MIYRRKDPPGGGTPLIKLPPRIEHIKRLTMNSLERLVYDYVQMKLPVKSIFARLIRMRQGGDAHHIIDYMKYDSRWHLACDHACILNTALHNEEFTYVAEVTNITKVGVKLKGELHK
jgi:hypothetical protein